jgi:uncharacterized protein YwqG
MEMSYYLPEEILPFKDQLIESKTEFVEIEPVEEDDIKLWNSKFGGQPYLPKDIPFPTTPEGEELFFLAQINFAEMPPLAPFPEKGIVQFYINDDGRYGQNDEDPFAQDYFRVLFFEEVVEDESQLRTDFSELREYFDLPVYAENCFKMVFEKSNEIVPVTDYRFQKYFSADFFEQFGETQWDVYGMYNESVSAEGHKIGGYAHFAQEDPRSEENPLELLFQMDTDVEIESMWGDMGTCNFFISAEALAKKDFSKVMYHWDCH